MGRTSFGGLLMTYEPTSGPLLRRM
jgi:hypothetical protein